MRTCLGLLLVLTAMAEPVFANGGGYFRGGVEGVGGIAGFEPQATENIRLLDEKLTVALGPEEAEVEIRYLMRNEAQKRVKVRFGFPVEESFDQDYMREPDEPAPPQPKQPRYCKDYVISAAGKPVAAKWQGEQLPAEDERFKGIAGWLVSEVTFGPGEEIPVQIHFRSGYPREHWSVSDDGSTTASIFKYRLSTAACWAGTIGTGKITLKPAGIDPRELKVLKPVNRFKQDGENWVWDFANLEPTMADDLEVEASPATRSYPAGDDNGTHIKRGSRWTLAHSNFTIAASSTLPPAGEHSYPAENVKSSSNEAVWSEGAAGPGIGEWLELKPAEPKPLDAIEIWPGYGMSKNLFQANARPKKILVELNGEYRFHADIADSPAELRIPIIGYTKPVKTLRLTFAEVWPGTQYEDLCVSAIQLHAVLEKEPKIRQAR